jgi:hypothetical protein
MEKFAAIKKFIGSLERVMRDMKENSVDHIAAIEAESQRCKDGEGWSNPERNSYRNALYAVWDSTEWEDGRNN